MAKVDGMASDSDPPLRAVQQSCSSLALKAREGKKIIIGFYTDNVPAPSLPATYFRHSEICMYVRSNGAVVEPGACDA